MSWWLLSGPLHTDAMLENLVESLKKVFEELDIRYEGDLC